MRKRKITPWIVVGIVLSILAAVYYWGRSTQPAQPTRDQTAASQAIDTLDHLPKSTSVAASDIVRLQVPAVSIDAGSTGVTWPRHTRRCHASTVCIDPPESTKVAWYGAYALPSFPNHGSVLVYGHSNPNSNVRQVFNDLPAVHQGDTVIVTTKTGVFYYRTSIVTGIPFEEVATSTLIYGTAKNRIALISCDLRNSTDAVVVIADLVTATPR